LVDSNKKFHEWAKKINDSLVANKLKELPSQYKWLLYWLTKIGEDDVIHYRESRDEARKLLKSSAIRLREESFKELEDARKHRFNTKIRFNKLMSYVYSFNHYIHPLLIRADLNQLAYDTMNTFNNEFLDELAKNAERGNLFQATLMLSYFYSCKDIGLVIRGEYITVFHDVVKSLKKESFFFIYAVRFNIAETNLEEGRLIQGVLLFCEGLRTFVRYQCEYHGIEIKFDYYESGKSVNRPFVDLLADLEREGVLTTDEVFRFTDINAAWYEKVGEPDFVQPNVKTVEKTIEDVRKTFSRIEVDMLTSTYAGEDKFS
jgi:hypothetical protein